MIEKLKGVLPALLFALAILLSLPPSAGVASLPTLAPAPATPLAVPGQGLIKASPMPVLEAATARAPAVPISFLEGAGYTYRDGVYQGTAMGYNGAITVQVTVNEGRIASVVILSHIEDQEYLDRATRVINAIVNSQSTNVDAVSGATYTSNAIILAVRDALHQAIVEQRGALPEEQPLAELPPAPVQREDPPEELTVNEELESQRFLDGAYTGTAEGYNGDITVEVLILKGQIASVELLSHKEDVEYLDKAMAVTTAILQNQSTNVDVVSGATYSSVGIILAVRDALLKAVAVEDSIEDPGLSLPILPPDPDADYIPLYGQYNDGEYAGAGAGYEGWIFLKVVIANNSIASIEVTRQIEEPAYYKSCIGLLDRVIKRQSTDGIDAVTGATYTSRGLLDAVRQALSQARIPASSDAAETLELPAVRVALVQVRAQMWTTE
jgi:uncharacterized protein with FMN-binding domain